MPAGSLKAIFPGVIQSFPNPHAPLKFEKLPGEVASPEYDRECGRLLGLGNMMTYTPVVFSYEKNFSSPEAFRAYELSKQAVEDAYYEPEQALQLADEALGISSICPEAYNVLAQYR